MIINITASICFIITVTILTYDFFSKEKIDKIENKYFKILAPLTLIGLFLELTLYSMLVLGVNYKSSIIEIITKCIFLYYVVFMYIYVLYTFCTCWNIENTDDKKYIIIKKILTILYGMFLVTVLVLPNYYVKKDNYFYPTGLCTRYSYIIGTIGILFIVCSYVKNIQKIPIKKNIPIFGSLVFALISVALQFRFPELLLLIPAHAITIVMLYFSIENPDIKMLEEVSLAKDVAEKANIAKTDFLSSMSHEIRTPLNAIVGFSESLKEDDVPHAAKEKISDIITASNNLLDIVNGILDISKIEANKLEIINKEYEPNELFKELVSLTKARIGDKGLELKVNIAEDIPAVVYGDVARVKQIILNILTNAVKYTKEGYIVFNISPIIKNNVCRFIISVEDTGIGIKQENISKLFSKFERLEVEKQLTIEGTGLGLAITKKLLDLMNGTIIVQSIYGKGSKFTISLDQKIVSMDAPLEKKPADIESKIIDANGAKLLIVDDNEMNIKVAITLLKKYHFNIDYCDSGLTCLSKVKDNEDYDIILLDDMMPHMNGKQTLAKLKEQGITIPVIALTANAITGMKEEYLNSGFDDYLSKPIEKSELERIIKKFIMKNNKESINTETSLSATTLLQQILESPQPEVIPNKILVMDDNIYTGKLLEEVLYAFNIEATSVTTTKEAIKNVIENKYDLIFLDESLKDKKYDKVINDLQSISGFNTPIVLIINETTSDKLKEKIKKLGFSGYISKPINNIEVETTYASIAKK